LTADSCRSYAGNYSAYERIKAGQARGNLANAASTKFGAQGGVWIRKAVEARRAPQRDASQAGRLRGGARRPPRARRETDALDRRGRPFRQAGSRSSSDVGKALWRVDVVERPSLRIGRGDRIGLIGANGAGKSTPA